MSSAETEVTPVLPTWPTGYTAENPAFGSAANSAPGWPSLPPLQEPSRPSAPAPSGAWAASRRDPSLPVSPPARRPRKSAPYLPPRASSHLAADPSQSVRGSFCPALLLAPRGRARARPLPWQRETSGPRVPGPEVAARGRSRSARGRGLPRATGAAADRCVGRGQRWPAGKGKGCPGEKRK